MWEILNGNVIIGKKYLNFTENILGHCEYHIKETITAVQTLDRRRICVMDCIP
jgi:hypothetical protein